MIHNIQGSLILSKICYIKPLWMSYSKSTELEGIEISTDPEKNYYLMPMLANGYDEKNWKKH